MGALAAALVAGCGGGDSGQATAAQQQRASQRADRAADMTLTLAAHHPGTIPYHAHLRAKPGQTIQFRAHLFSSGGKQARHVRVQLSAPDSLHLIGASQLIQDVTVKVANARPLPGNLRNGVALNPFPPDAASNLKFEMKVRPDAKRGAEKIKLTLRGIGFSKAATTTIHVR